MAAEFGSLMDRKLRFAKRQKYDLLYSNNSNLMLIICYTVEGVS